MRKEPAEEKGTSQTQRPVSLQRTGYEDSALSRSPLTPPSVHRVNW
jgi:hypothetical protein